MRNLYIIICFILLVSSMHGCATTPNTPNTSKQPTDPPTASVTPADTAETTAIPTDEEKIRQYFQDNSWPLQLSDDDAFIDYPIDDDELDGMHIFFTGEMHGTAANYPLRMAYLKYFKEKTQFKYYLYEHSYSASYFLNQYLTSGDESLLDLIFQSHRGTDIAMSEEEVDFWKDLYVYNHTLPETDRITVVGVDVNSDIYMAYHCLRDMLQGGDVPLEIQETQDLIDETLDIVTQHLDQRRQPLENTRDILERMDTHRAVFEDHLGENFVPFQLVLHNVLNFEVTRKLTSDWTALYQTRDQMIYENFLVLDAHLPSGKYFGQWGALHISQQAANDVQWFASHLNAVDSIYHNQILSIMFSYMDSEYIEPGSSTIKELNMMPPVIQENQTHPDASYVLYDVDSITMPASPDGPDNDLSDYFQYILLIRGSKAVTPLY